MRRLIPGTAIFVCALSGAFTVHPALAGGLFDFLFRHPFEDRQAAPPQESRSYAPQDPAYREGSPENVPGGGRWLGGPRISGGNGRFTAYCVRLCDGHYFPVQPAHAGQLCSAFCPASKTKVFAGTDVAEARASDGARYADLENAFVYRDHLVDGCTCNGVDSAGLARIDVKNDPTAQRGDMVATANGLQRIEPVNRPASAENELPPPLRRRRGFFPFSFFR